MQPLQLLGINMVDEASETYSGGLKNWLGALGFILPLAGIEELIRIYATGAKYPGWQWIDSGLIAGGLLLYWSPAFVKTLRRLFISKKESTRTAADKPDQELGLKLNVHKIYVQVPRLNDGVIHMTVEFFNGNSFGLHIKGISGTIDVTKEDANGNRSKVCTLVTPSFAETRRTYVLPHDEFAFSMAQQLPSKLADEFRAWPAGTKYNFDLGDLNIIVQSETGIESVRIPLWDGFQLEMRDGRISTSKQVLLRPGSLMRGLSHLIEPRE
jgi:hypothetical protein